MLATPTSRSPRRPAHSHPRAANSPRRRDAGLLACYVDRHGRPREILTRPGHAGSVLVLDRDAHTLGDRRLVAHLGADEPPGNAALVCRHYLHDPRGRRCGRLTAEDLRSPGPGVHAALDGASGTTTDFGVDTDPSTSSREETPDPNQCFASAIVDREGHMYRLGCTTGRLAVPELRWLRDPGMQAVSVREVVGCTESYEPVRARTRAAIARHGGDAALSVAVLRAELRRMDASRIVLNRALREAVQDAIRERGLSMSEIALRCGRVKHDARGNPSGETSWLARRVGLAPEGGEQRPTPWVHSDVLALIARAGLDINPCEVELG